MERLVVYCSQTGSARKYATWLAEDLGCVAVPLTELERQGERCGLIVLCSWFHAASLKGAKQFKAYMAAHPEKRYVVVGVGATPMPGGDYDASEHEEAFRRSFPVEDYADLPWCYCQGDFHFERLGAVDKVAMRIYFKMLEKGARAGSARDAEALEDMRRGIDGCDRSYLEPLLREIERLG